MRSAYSKSELKAMYPKGCARPSGYVARSLWAEAQIAHGLKQLRCECHALWLFPQERDEHPGPFVNYTQFLQRLGAAGEDVSHER